MKIFWFVAFVNFAATFPSRWRKNIAENAIFDSFDNYLPKFDEVPGFEFGSFENASPSPKVSQSVDSHIQSIPGKSGKTIKNKSPVLKENITSTTTTTTSTVTPQTTKNSTRVARINSSLSILDPELDKSETKENDTNQEEEFGEASREKEKESQEEEGSSEEEPNMLTGLLSAFLGGLSRPDGSIDLEAILGLLGSLSTQNPDGSYDFSGLTEILKSFFGGEGGSDVGAFAGGLVGALLRGLAAPPGGAKGVGIFTGKVLGGILPALSGPPPSDGDATTVKPPPLDSGGFASGLLKSIFQSSGGNVSKFSLIKSVIGLITSLSRTSSSLSFGKPSDWNQPPPPPPPPPAK